MKIRPTLAALLALLLSVSTVTAGSVPVAKPEEVGLSTERLKRVGEDLWVSKGAFSWPGGSGVAF